MMEISDYELREQLLAKGYKNPPPVTDTSRLLLLEKLKKLKASTPDVSIVDSQNIKSDFELREQSLPKGYNSPLVTATSRSSPLKIDLNETKSRKRNPDSSFEKNNILDGLNEGARPFQMRSSRKDARILDSPSKRSRSLLSPENSSFSRNDPFERGSDSDDSVPYSKTNSRASLLTRKPLKRESEYFSSPSYKKFDVNNGAGTSYLSQNFNRGRYSHKNRNVCNKLTHIFLSPTFVLVMLLLFFLFVVGVYYFKDDRSYGELSFHAVDKCKCTGRNRRNCILESEIDGALYHLNILYRALWKNELNAICGNHNFAKTEMFGDDVVELLVHESGLLRYESEKMMKYVQILVEANPHFKIIWSDEKKSFRLENYDLPWRCTFRTLFSGIINYTYYLILAVPLIYSLYSLHRWVASIFQERDREKKDLVTGILDILQQNAMANPSQNYMPIVHVRDQLISYSARERKKKPWLDAVKYVEENESRIRKEIQPFQGEDYDVWRWIGGQLSAPKPKTWQGEAFETSGDTRNTPTISPTPCLKIRHMFNPKNETADEDWGTGVKDAILERCEGINIVHMMVDETSPEGCVYIKCASAEDAGKAYRKIHGAWFDGNIVTVKYLRLERYHERFPASLGLTKSLIPSNDQKRSLA